MSDTTPRDRLVKMGTDAIHVRVSTGHAQFPFLRQSPNGSGRWGRYQFHFDTDISNADAWIVCDGLRNPEACVCPPSNVILATWEPPSGVHYDTRFLRQFSQVITCHKNLNHPRIHFGLQGHPWHVERDFDTLLTTPPPTKQRDICVISSDKEFWEGHRLRLDFVTKLKQRMGDQIDLFGRGINTFESKWETLLPYKYSVVIENDRADDWITEKLFDCYLTATFPIYYGAPNVRSYLPEGSLKAIDIERPDAAMDAIQSVIDDEGHYERSMSAIAAARLLYLTKLQLFPLFADFLDRNYVNEMPQSVLLQPQQATVTPTRLERWKQRLLGRLTR
jgi:hypothetical protein